MMSHFDQRVERKADLVCYLIQKNESIHLSNQSRHDIFWTMRDVADYWKKELDEIQKDNPQKKWNELKLWRKRYPFATYEDLDIVMAMLDAGLYIRDFKPQGF